MLRYKKSNDQKHHAAGFNGLLDALANVTLEKGRGREVVVPDWLKNAVASGQGEALTHLAGLHLGAHRNGQGLADAEPLLREAAQKGYAPAQEQLGIISILDLGANAVPGEAAGWLRLAADQGMKGAQSLLGMMLASGIGIERDLPEARRLLALAELHGDRYAMLCLHSGSKIGLLPQVAAFSLGMLRVIGSVISGLSDDAGDIELQSGITALANAGDADACFVLCVLNYSAGNRADALRWCLTAAGIGNELAVLITGLLAFIDHDGIRDMYPAAEWLEAAARRESAPAQGLLGLMYATGRGAARDVSEANRLFDQAADGLDPSTPFGKLFVSSTEQSFLEPIMHLLGKALAAHLFHEGSASSEGSFDLVREAMRFAEEGDRFAQLFVGMALWSGSDVAQDQAGAVRWMKEAAGQGVKEAQLFLGICFDKGDSVDPDREEAIRWFRLAAEQRDTTAQFALASAYMFGDGVEKDMEEATRWFRLAAEQGNATAQYHLGDALLKGNGVIQDPAAGAEWLLQSANQGHVDAQYLIGLCFLDGDGVGKDVMASIRWLLKAAEQGSQDAVNFLKDIQ